ncbi:MAG: helix-turn-helix domain-containing protein [Flavobacteriaceae bacterium]|nr:helix-turn-helix domain-containing protein [Flavobacteriaceae bacterium]
MEELNLKQKDLADVLGTYTTRISEYMRGNREISLEIAFDSWYRCVYNIVMIKYYAYPSSSLKTRGKH